MTTPTELETKHAADVLQTELFVAARLIRALQAAIDDYSKMYILARTEGRKQQILDVIGAMGREVAILTVRKQYALANPAEVVEAYRE